MDERLVRQAAPNRAKANRSKTLRAEVLSVDKDGAAAWVRIDGGASSTHAEIASGVTVAQGQEVSVLVEGHRATVTGSYTMRATDDTRADQVASMALAGMAEVADRSAETLGRESAERQAALAELAQRLAESPGLYHVEENDGAGGTIHYLCDHETLESSKVIYKLTAEAIGISTDGGKTYSTGLTAEGTAILQRIYTIGLDASYINTGTLDASVVTIANLLAIGSDGVGKVVIDSAGMHVYDSAGSLVAEYGTSKVKLGTNSSASSVEMCGGRLTVSYDSSRGSTISSAYGAVEVQSVGGITHLMCGSNGIYAKAYGVETMLKPVHHLYNPNAGTHHFTTSDTEKNNLVSAGWQYQGDSFYAFSK